MKISQLLSLPFSFSLIASSAAAFENNPFIAEYNTLIAEYTQKSRIKNPYLTNEDEKYTTFTNDDNSDAAITAVMNVVDDLLTKNFQQQFEKILPQQYAAEASSILKNIPREAGLTFYNIHFEAKAMYMEETKNYSYGSYNLIPPHERLQHGAYLNLYENLRLIRQKPISTSPLYEHQSTYKTQLQLCQNNNPIKENSCLQKKISQLKTALFYPKKQLEFQNNYQSYILNLSKLYSILYNNSTYTKNLSEIEKERLSQQAITPALQQIYEWMLVTENENTKLLNQYP